MRLSILFRLSLFISFLISLDGTAQISGNAMKLVGEWKYNKIEGFERWEESNGALIGSGYLKSAKKDTVIAYKFRISEFNGRRSFLHESTRMVGEATDDFLQSRLRSQDMRLIFINLSLIHI